MLICFDLLDSKISVLCNQINHSIHSNEWMYTYSTYRMLKYILLIESNQFSMHYARPPIGTISFSNCLAIRTTATAVQIAWRSQSTTREFTIGGWVTCKCKCATHCWPFLLVQRHFAPGNVAVLSTEPTKCNCWFPGRNKWAGCGANEPKPSNDSSFPSGVTLTAYLKHSRNLCNHINQSQVHNLKLFWEKMWCICALWIIVDITVPTNMLVSINYYCLFYEIVYLNPRFRQLKFNKCSRITETQMYMFTVKQNWTSIHCRGVNESTYYALCMSIQI